MDINEQWKKDVGNRIKNIRITSSRVQEELQGKKPTLERFAKLIDSNKSNASRWERGLNVPNEITLRKIAEYGDMTVDELLHGPDNELMNKVTKFTNEIMDVETKEMGSEKYKMLYSQNFKKEALEYILKHSSFDNLTDVGIKQYTKQLLDNYLDKKQDETKYEPHTNENAKRYVYDLIHDKIMQRINDYFRASYSENLYSYLKEEDIKESLSYDLYYKLVETMEIAIKEIEDADAEQSDE